MLALGIWESIKNGLNWLLQAALGLGGPGLFLLAMADSSFLSVPEGNDLLIVVKSTGQSWPLMSYFVIMTVLGSTLGCSLLYSVGRWGGRRFQRRFDGPRIEEIRRLYERRGVWTVAVPAVLPPPTPFKIFVFSAGLFRLPYPRFVLAVLLGRSIRYFMWGVLALLYGTAVRDFIVVNAKPVGTLLLAIVAALLAFYFFRRISKRRSSKTGTRSATVVLLLIFVVMTGFRCSIKKTTKIPIPDAHLAAQEAGLDDLVRLVNNRYSDFDNLVFLNLEVEFTGEAVQEGIIEEDKYRRADGVMIARRPNDIYLNIKNPLGGASLAVMASSHGQFQIFLPRDNKFYTGPTDIVLDEQDKDVRLSVRPHHLVEGLMIERLERNGSALLILKQDEDERFKYYVISVVRIAREPGSGDLVRELWFERSRMELVRQRYYEWGEVTADITYARPAEIGERLVPTEIKIERPRQRYSMRFELNPEEIQINRSLKENTFQVTRPASAELIELAAKNNGLP